MEKKNYIKILFFVVFIVSHYNGHAFWKWTKIQPLLSGKRSEASSFSLNGKGYVSCGIDSNDNCYNDLWQYDPTFNFWTQKANLPASYRRASIGFELNNMGYLGGGIDNAVKALGTLLTDFWMYNPTTNSWTNKATVPEALFRAASTTCLNKGYMICGANSFMGTLNVYTYEPLSDVWTNVSAFTPIYPSVGGREGGVATTINNKIYFGMGKDENYYQKDWWEFNPTTLAWTKKTDFPASGRIGAFAFTLNNIGIIGMGSDGIYNDDTWQYNPITDAWNYVATFSGNGRRNPAYFVIGNVGFMGTGNSGTGEKQDFYRLDADVSVNNLSKDDINFQIISIPNGINILSDDERFKTSDFILYNLEGKEILKEKLETNSTIISTHQIPFGIYFATITSNNNLIKSQKIIIN